MENNSDLNNQAAQYTLCFNTRCPKAENCLRHSMTQYTTAQNIRLSVRHHPPLLSGGREGVPALSQQQENTGGMGLQETLR